MSVSLAVLVFFGSLGEESGSFVSVVEKVLFLVASGGDIYIGR